MLVEPLMTGGGLYGTIPLIIVVALFIVIIVSIFDVWGTL